MDYVNNGKYAKPSGYFLKHTLKEFNIALSQETALYIGDSQVDIMAACDAGIASCLINRQNAKKNRSEDWKAKPTYIISDFHELLKI